MPNVFGIANDIVGIGYKDDGRDYDETMQKVLQRFREVILKLKKDKYHFRCMSIPFFGEVMSRNRVQPDPHRIKVLMEMLAPNNKKELQAFPGIINYLKKILF